MSDNVVSFPGTYHVSDENEQHIVSIDNVLEGVKQNNVEQVFVVGLGENGELYLASNIPNMAKFVYILELAKMRLLGDVFDYDT